MKDDLYKDFLKHYSPQFGEIAVGMKFVTEQQLNEALVEQVEDDFSKEYSPAADNSKNTCFI